MQDPVYPVYVDTSVMAGRTGEYLGNGYYDRLVYLPCTAENGFIPEIPKKKVDIIFLCYPNNPTGTTAGKQELKKWVDYAIKNKAIILYDSAYEAYISDPEIPQVWVNSGRGIKSWDLFDKLLHEAYVVGTPGSGFGPSGEGYFRFSSFATHESVLEAMDRLGNLKW